MARNRTVITVKRSFLRRAHRASAVTLFILLACALSASACSAGNNAAGAGTSTSGHSPIVIGASVSLSGDFSADGSNYVNAYKLWADQENAHGGLLGHPIKLDLVSDGSDPNQVTTDYNSLIGLDHASLLLGPYSTLLTVPAEKVAARNGYALVFGSGGGSASFASGYKNIFDVSPPVLLDLMPFVNWIASLPPSERPKTAAYPTSNDPFTEPSVQWAEQKLSAMGIKTVYSKVFPAEVTDYTPIANAVAASNAQLVVVGSTGVPDIAPFVTAFASQHYNPKVLIATSGPDQGPAFSKVVGANNTSGIMFPNGWYPEFPSAMSQAMVKAYVKKYGGTINQVSPDVAEAYSAGQVLADAVNATHSFNNQKIIAYLHSGVTFNTVQGPVKFNSIGENPVLPAYVFQWQNGQVVQVLPTNSPGSVKVLFPKPGWGS